MSEGELKRRSLLLAAIGRLDRPLSGQALANHNGEMIDKFWELLDEAKKEFPDFEKIGNLPYYRSEIDNWRRKWFGRREDEP